MNIKSFKRGEVITRVEATTSHSKRFLIGRKVMLIAHDERGKNFAVKVMTGAERGDIIHLKYEVDRWDEGWQGSKLSFWQKLAKFFNF